MGLKILHSADWHLDSPFASLPGAVRGALRRAQEKLPDMAAELCRREGCDLVLLAGDLFDGIPSRETVERVKRALARCGVPVCIAPGNHDPWGPDCPWQESWPENVHIFKGGLSWVDFPALDCRVYGAGYESMDCPPLLEKFRAEGESRWCLGVLHGDPMNSSSPNCPVTAAQVRESGLDYLALGHIHRRGSFRAGETLCAWPGCPMGRGWDETGERGVLLVNLEQSAADWIPLPLPCFYDLKVPVEGDAPTALEGVLPPTESPNLYRVTLTGNGPVEVEALGERFSHLAYLELRDETEEETNPFDLAGEDSLRGVYFRLLKERLDAGEDGDTIRLAAKLSARLLDGKEVALP